MVWVILWLLRGGGHPFLRLRSSLSTLPKAVFRTIKTERRPIKPMTAVKVSTVVKLDQVSMEVL
jgi:hypothetical protein